EAEPQRRFDLSRREWIVGKTEESRRDYPAKVWEGGMVQDIVRAYTQGEVVLATTGADFAKETASTSTSPSTTASKPRTTAHVAILASRVLRRLSTIRRLGPGPRRGADNRPPNAECFGEIQIHGHPVGPIAKVTRNDQITGLWIQIEYSESRCDGT